MTVVQRAITLRNSWDTRLISTGCPPGKYLGLWCRPCNW
jgi:hypothetical protein